MRWTSSRWSGRRANVRRKARQPRVDVKRPAREKTDEVLEEMYHHGGNETFPPHIDAGQEKSYEKDRNDAGKPLITVAQREHKGGKEHGGRG